MGQATGFPVKEYFVNGRFFILFYKHVRAEHSKAKLICLVAKEPVNCNQKLKLKIFGV
tara:strand:- start:265 stop:438 length:174 start_codon:yes stop_codon:yes gene_type:complete